MLVLSRKEGEKLVIGDNITLVVSKIAGNRVTVGIEAPADVKIFRGELAEREKPDVEPQTVPLRRAATVTIDLERSHLEDMDADLPGVGNMRFEQNDLESGGSPGNPDDSPRCKF